MARLRDDEKASKEYQVVGKLRKHVFGIRESELAIELDWQKRTLNNYLRRLQQRGEAYKEGRSWFSED